MEIRFGDMKHFKKVILILNFTIVKKGTNVIKNCRLVFCKQDSKLTFSINSKTRKHCP